MIDDPSKIDNATAVEMLRKARRDLNLTQAQLASMLWVSAGTLGRWERGESAPGLNEAARWAAAVGSPLRIISRNRAIGENP